MKFHSIGRTLTGLTAAGALACTMSLAGAGLAQADGTDPNSDTTASQAVDKNSVMVELSIEPLATSSKVDRGNNRKVNPNGTKTKNERAAIAQQRNALRAWMKTNAPKATITGEYDFAINAVGVQLNGTNPDVLKSAPGVKDVTFQQIFTKAADDPDLALIDAPQGWSAAGATSAAGDPTTWAGYGVKVGIVDSGIDANHPCFDDAGFPATTQLGDKKLTNNKVIVAKVYYNKAAKSGFDASAQDDHGTHVAGTVGCNLRTPAAIEGADIPYDPSGVAPGVQLGNYNVFPGTLASARSQDIVAALNDAAADGMDVINMSLGGGTHSARDIYSTVITKLDQAGIVVAIANGNEGPGYVTAGSPGVALDAITAGASSVGHYVGSPILANGGQVAVAAIGDFPTPSKDLTGTLTVVTNADGTLGDGCTALTANSLTGQIALISRGTCSFGNKVSNAEKAGAVGVIIVNNSPGDPIAMATDEAFPTTIPAVMVGLDARGTLMGLADQAVTIGAEKAYRDSNNDNILMGFSSWGPVPVTYDVKPDVVAPGGNVISSLPLQYCKGQADVETVGCWGLMSGTSMASPHVAGMAAVVKDAHPTWSGAHVRSAISNTAKISGVLQTNAITKPETDVLKVGNGLADLDAAVNAKLGLSKTTVSFGAVPKAAGQTKSQTITVTNLTNTSITTPVAIEKASGQGFSVNTSKLTIPAHGSATVTVTWTSPKKSASSLNQAHLTFGSTAHVALFAYLG